MNALHTYTYDGNGNVTDIVGTNGTSLAHYEYDPFGRTISSSGTFAEENRWKFSTKCMDESGLYYYGYRYYSPELGRWPSRDPIEEQGGLNLYGFVNNAPLASVDFIGLWLFCRNTGSPTVTTQYNPGHRILSAGLFACAWYKTKTTTQPRECRTWVDTSKTFCSGTIIVRKLVWKPAAPRVTSDTTVVDQSGTKALAMGTPDEQCPPWWSAKKPEDATYP